MVCILRPGDGKDSNQGFSVRTAAPLGGVPRGLSPAWTERGHCSQLWGQVTGPGTVYAEGHSGWEIWGPIDRH